MFETPVFLDPTFIFNFATPVHIVWGVVLSVAIIFIIYSIFLLYHAIRYGEGASVITLALIAYFSVSFILGVSIFSSAIFLTT